jgi:S-adenosylmethionine synthetase
MAGDFIFMCESVTEGHPDKLCDQISDATVDQFLLHDPLSRVLTECAVSNGVLFIACRYASTATVDIPEIARHVIEQVGYDGEDFGARRCTVMTSLVELDVEHHVNGTAKHPYPEDPGRITASHMTNAFGYACTQTEAMIPLPLWLGHKLARRLAGAGRKGRVRHLAPDGRVQVGVEFHGRMPHRIHSITLVASVEKGLKHGIADLRAELTETVIRPSFQGEAIFPDAHTFIHVNPEGASWSGGPSVHSGLTGRKNAIDTYGEYSRQSAAALSGKDPARIDRIAAYAARYAAKNTVAAKLASECEVHLTYAIGHSVPVSVRAQTFGTGTVSDDEITARIRRHFDFRPAAIARDFDLRRLPARHGGNFYRRLAAYGHMGRCDLDVPWEHTDRVALLT